MQNQTSERTRHIWKTIQAVLRERVQGCSRLLEQYSFYVYRTDTNAVLARGIEGYEAAKEKANQIRKQYGLKWDQVKFKADRTPGVSADGKRFRGAYGRGGRIEYAPRYNPS